MISDILFAAQPYFQALFAALLSIGIPLVLRRLKISNDNGVARVLQGALDAAAGAAYTNALQQGGFGNPVVFQRAVQAGAAYVVSTMPDAIQSTGMTPAAVRDAVEARLGVLLAQDPTVSAGQPGGPK